MKRTLNIKTLPLLSAEQKARLDVVAVLSDEKIDYSDAPFLPDAVWLKAAKEPPLSEK